MRMHTEGVYTWRSSGVYRIPPPLSVDPSSVRTPFPCLQLSEETEFLGKGKVHVSTEEPVLLSLCSAACFI